MFNHCRKLIFFFGFYRFEIDTGLQFDLQRRDFGLLGYFVVKLYAILALLRFVLVAKLFLDCVVAFTWISKNSPE
jgi:hypothetical protein